MERNIVKTVPTPDMNRIVKLAACVGHWRAIIMISVCGDCDDADHKWRATVAGPDKTTLQDGYGPTAEHALYAVQVGVERRVEDAAQKLRSELNVYEEALRLSPSGSK